MHIVNRIRRLAPCLWGYMSGERGFEPDFKAADLVVICAVLWNRVSFELYDRATAVDYFLDRNCSYSRETLDLVFELFEGDDEVRHLWSVDRFGTYTNIDDTGVSDYVPDLPEMDPWEL